MVKKITPKLEKIHQDGCPLQGSLLRDSFPSSFFFTTFRSSTSFPNPSHPSVSATVAHPQHVPFHSSSSGWPKREKKGKTKEKGQAKKKKKKKIHHQFVYLYILTCQGVWDGGGKTAKGRRRKKRKKKGGGDPLLSYSVLRSR